MPSPVDIALAMYRLTTDLSCFLRVIHSRLHTETLDRVVGNYGIFDGSGVVSGFAKTAKKTSLRFGDKTDAGLLNLKLWIGKKSAELIFRSLTKRHDSRFAQPKAARRARARDGPSDLTVPRSGRSSAGCNEKSPDRVSDQGFWN
uniref:hypothetical protein n=1 Tax=Microbulbifer agarilyticus TaxID=260552 RepID=UPI001ED911ED